MSAKVALLFALVTAACSTAAVEAVDPANIRRVSASGGYDYGGCLDVVILAVILDPEPCAAVWRDGPRDARLF
jgi:hypothetical protein